MKYLSLSIGNLKYILYEVLVWLNISVQLGRGHTGVEYTCMRRTSFPTDTRYLFRRALLYVHFPVSRCTSYRLFGHFTLYCELLRKRIIQEGEGHT
jgi:hypothetical protein